MVKLMLPFSPDPVAIPEPLLVAFEAPNPDPVAMPTEAPARAPSSSMGPCTPDIAEAPNPYPFANRLPGGAVRVLPKPLCPLIEVVANVVEVQRLALGAKPFPNKPPVLPEIIFEV